jgi:flagellar motor switch protein FliN/FliY
VSTFDKVSVDITVVLGTTFMPIHQVLRLGRGAIIELESSEDDAVQILANNLPVASGTVVVAGNRRFQTIISGIGQGRRTAAVQGLDRPRKFPLLGPQSGVPGPCP